MNATVKTGLLLVNLGTPTAATAPALRRYLAEFLTDQRVVELPPLLWRPILHGIILRLRPKRSAALYQKIWLAEGSPLRVYSERLAQGLQHYFDQHHKKVQVRLAMRYGQPNIEQGLQQFKAQGIEHVIVLPLYPQYSATTTASIFDAVARVLMSERNLPALNFIRDYHQHPAYIQALCKNIQQHWQQHGRGQHLVMSFHGIPNRCVVKGDPYAQQCKETAQLLAVALELGDDDWSIAFQSRFGYETWLQPYCDDVLKQLPKRGINHIDVVCPGFAADCLETLEEINQQYRKLFLQAGGTQFNYIPALNDCPEHVQALAEVIQTFTADGL